VRKQDLNEEVFVVTNNTTKTKFVVAILKPSGKQFKNEIRLVNKNFNRNKNGNPQMAKNQQPPDRTIDKYKARLVAKGFRQRENIVFFNIYSPVT